VRWVQAVALYNYVSRIHRAVWATDASPTTFRRTSEFGLTCKLLDVHYKEQKQSHSVTAGWKWLFFDRHRKSSLVPLALAAWCSEHASLVPDGLPDETKARLRLQEIAPPAQN